MVPVIPEGPAGDLGKQLLSEKRQGLHGGWRRGESGGPFGNGEEGSKEPPCPAVCLSHPVAAQSFARPPLTSCPLLRHLELLWATNGQGAMQQ